MTVSLMATIQRWIGLSTDSKPSSPAPAKGSTFFETDTLDEYIYNVAWTLKSSGLVWQKVKKVSSVFDGGTANAHGNDGGTSDPYGLFTVTGDVVAKAIWGVINTDLTGATATVEVGVAGNTAGLIAQELATDMDDGALYVSGTVADGVAQLANTGLWVINDGADIIETVATADVTAGQIDYYCIWAGMEAGSNIVAA